MTIAQSTISDAELIQRLPGVIIDEFNKEHWRAMFERRLVLPRCQDCGHWLMPIRDFCSECWSTNVGWEEVSGKGTLHLYVIYHQGRFVIGPATRAGTKAGNNMYETPFPAGAAELVEQKGLRFIAPLVNVRNEDIRHDMPLELTWIDRGGVPAPGWQPAGVGR